jgi:hypothetical protein
MREALAAALLVAGCSNSGFRDATAEKVKSVAAKCGAVLIHFYPNLPESQGRLSHGELGLPNVSLTIDTQNRAEFSTKAGCINRELNALGAFSFINGPNGESLLVDDGRDRIS